MSVSNEAHNPQVLDEMLRDELNAIGGLFVDALRASAPLSGRVVVPDGKVDLQWQHNQVSPSFVVTHEQNIPVITEDWVILPIATKYAVGVSGDPVYYTPQWVGKKQYDLTAERKIARELFDFSDRDVASQFVDRFDDETTGHQALQARKTLLLDTKARLHSRRDAEVIDGRNVPVEDQLRTALHLRELLETVRQAEPRQIAQVVVGREVELDD